MVKLVGCSVVCERMNENSAAGTHRVTLLNITTFLLVLSSSGQHTAMELFKHQQHEFADLTGKAVQNLNASKQPASCCLEKPQNNQPLHVTTHFTNSIQYSTVQYTSTPPLTANPPLNAPQQVRPHIRQQHSGIR